MFRMMKLATVLAVLATASALHAQPAPKMNAETKAAFDTCVAGGIPGTTNAEKRAAACSKAIQSRQLSPDELARARFDRGGARMAMGNRVMAESDYMEALRRYDSAIDPRNPDALNLYRRGATLDALGQDERALSDFNEAIRLDSKSAMAFFGRAALLATRKRAYQRAIEDLDKVIALEPANADAWMRRGDAYR
jgi:tetratricopeptide (TPR) repeat protein